MGDTCLILGHRMSELMGHAPVLEEDLSIANIALEQTDQARAWLTLAGQLEGQNRDEDQLAYFRDQNRFYNATLAEPQRVTPAIPRFDVWQLSLCPRCNTTGAGRATG